MSPNDILAELQASVQLTEEESRAFKALSESPAYAAALPALSRSLILCGDSALEDGNVDYWRGVRSGLSFFFELTEGEAIRANDLILETLHKEEQGEPDVEGDVDLTQAISSLGSSPL